MALPTTITGFAATTTNALWVTQPFRSSAGNVYIIGRGSTGTLLRAFKATDPTDSFSNVGTDLSFSSDLEAVAAYQVGDILHVVTENITSTPSFDIEYHTFDMSTDAWVVENEAVTTCTPDNAVVIGHIHIGVRSDGDVIVLYNGDFVNISFGNRETVYYARRESGTWTVDIDVGDGGAADWITSGLVVGASDRMHFFFTNDNAADGYQRTLTSSNALETFPSSYDTAVSATDTANHTVGVAYESGGATKIRFAQRDSGTNNTLSVKFDSADAPTVSTDEDITGARSCVNLPYSTSFVVDETTVYCLIAATDADLHMNSNADDAGWTTTAEIFSLPAAFNCVKANVYSRGGNIVIGYMINTAGSDTVYNEEVLRVDDSSNPSGPFESEAAATLIMAGAATAASSFNSDATATLSWVAFVEVIESADWDSDAAATLNWGGVTVAGAALESTAAANLSWDGASLLLVEAAFDMDATASVTWDGTALLLVEASFDMDAVASLAWGGEAVASSALSSTAEATLTWNSQAIAGSAWSSTAEATLTWNSQAIAGSDWSSTAAATLTWDGEDLEGATEGVWEAAATAQVTFASATIAAASFSMEAAASLAMASDSEPADSGFDHRIMGGRLARSRAKAQRIRELEAQDEEDMLFIVAMVYNYMESSNGHH